MSHISVKNRNRVERLLLCDYINSIISRTSSEPSLDEIYLKAVHSIIDSLITFSCSRELPPNERPYESDHERLISGLFENGVQSFNDVALFYERISGLKPQAEHGAGVVLVPSTSKRHNLGQFYTPPHVASEIVRLALNALDRDESPDLSVIQILDPAVGCGVFLAETVSQLLKRFREGDRNRADFLSGLPLLLHGVDLDPISVKITKSLLTSMLGTYNSGQDISLPNIRVGNSLIGNGGVSFESAGAEKQGFLPERPDTNGLPAKAKPGGHQSYRGNRFDWNVEFPHVFQRPNPGFDLIVGNPPYEVLSVKESSSAGLRHDINYFKSHYTSCFGKINTYRLMMERSLNLLRVGGIMGFIVPATFLADSSASALRRKILAECDILDLVTIPEKARLFSGVTQAFSIIIAGKGKPTTSVKPRMWGTHGAVDNETATEICVSDLEKIELRIPVLSSGLESRLMNHLMAFPTLSTYFPGFPPVGVHQGEINLTTHRRFISELDTGVKLVRGEHIGSFAVRHPSSVSNRFDWMKSDIFKHPDFRFSGKIRSRHEESEFDSTQGRVAVARVVNMGCEIRLKAAWVEPNIFLGDMTNYLDNVIISPGFTLGLLNSRLLNWRFKALSANNYISAAEIKSLPVPYQILPPTCPANVSHDVLKEILSEANAARSLLDGIRIINKISDGRFGHGPTINFLIASIEEVVGLIVTEMKKNQRSPTIDSSLRSVMDALVVILYSAGEFTEILEAQ